MEKLSEHFLENERLIVTRDLPIQTRKNINNNNHLLALLKIPENKTDQDTNKSFLHTEELYWYELTNPQIFQNVTSAIRGKEIDVVLDDDCFALEMLPIDAEKLPKTLIHVMQKKVYDKWILDGGNLGGNKEVNYLQKESILVEPEFDLYQPYQPYVKVYIETSKLLEKRKIYIDPESIHETPEEYGKSYIINGNIPNESITKIELCEFRYDHLPGKGERKRNYQYKEADVEIRKKNHRKTTRLMVV